MSSAMMRIISKSGDRFNDRSGIPRLHTILDNALCTQNGAPSPVCTVVSSYHSPAQEKFPRCIARLLVDWDSLGPFLATCRNHAHTAERSEGINGLINKSCGSSWSASNRNHSTKANNREKDTLLLP
jgi:hypothetical protein